MTHVLDALLGVTMREVVREGEGLAFKSEDGRVFDLLPDHDCCASVDLEDIAGDLSDLIGTPITLAEEATNRALPPKPEKGMGDYKPKSYTWTFYHFGTDKGRVVVRFYGESNGYYSESASLSRRD